MADEAAHYRRLREKLSTPVQFVKGVGPKRAEAFAAREIHAVRDLLFFLPYRYEDRSRIKLARELDPGKRETVLGQVLQTGEIPVRSRFGSPRQRRMRIFEVLFRDRAGAFFRAKWFHYRSNYLKKRFRPGSVVIVHGVIRVFRDQLEVIHPETEVLLSAESRPGPDRIIPDMGSLLSQVQSGPENLNFGRIVPIYREVEGIYLRALRAIMWEAVQNFSGFLVSGVPPEIAERNGLPGIRESVHRIHFPETGDDFDALEGGASLYHRRIIFEELFLLELGLALKRERARREPGRAIFGSGFYREKLRASLPFTLTEAQQRAVGEIEADLKRSSPMNRLLQGDVGSGKTIVAAFASLQVVEDNCQVALMAPTEILAEQHYRNLSAYFQALPVRTGLLTGSLGKKARDSMYRETAAGEINVLVGTHALIQDPLSFSRLGLVIIDEQHRFGVAQRARLRGKSGRGTGQVPHLLIMTATPIPRTLAMTLYGDLDVSVIDELPPGRQPVQTRVYREPERDEVYRIIGRQLERGSQVFVVYPLIEESEKLDLRDATRMSEDLRRRFPGFSIGIVHGRMKREERDRIMREFREGLVALLVATTVIEVGIDIPEATLMIVEHAERFGLSQLHQLRGRVGRGREPSTCILVSGAVVAPDSRIHREQELTFEPGEGGEEESTEHRAERRLRVMELTTDGFRIAEEDLKIRGPGDILGTRQSGFPVLRFAVFPRDFSILRLARKEAFELVAEDPGLSREGRVAAREMVKDIWKEKASVLSAG